ncbi:MAG: class I SAM-dependent methyltransferase [Chloroflexi bacterium]|nr:class I SAM-dependent methyltransferase [Chloroflexota bacterium]
MNDLVRLKTEYARRAHDPRYRDWYSPFNRANLFITQERDRAITQMLGRYIRGDWDALRILDVGCGRGNELSKFVGYGAAARNLFGVDLLGDRVREGRDKHSALQFSCGNAATLAYPDGAFDLVLQFTVFTSILDDELRRQIASEMLRVLRAGGAVLWYDYRLNPTNRQTRGIERAEIKTLFPNCEYHFRRVTLAPPLARLIAPHSWFACELLNQFFFLRTHWLAIISKN